MDTPFEHGRSNCYQDRCENVPFASIGGLEARGQPRPPRWISADDWPEYLRGYIACAVHLYGEDWQTCSFGWAPALEIPNERAEQRVLNLIAGGSTPEEAARVTGLWLSTVEGIIAHELGRRESRDAAE